MGEALCRWGGGAAKSALVAGVLAFDFFFVAPSACWSFFLIFHSLRCSLALRRTIPDMGPGAGIGYSCGLCPVWSGVGSVCPELPPRTFLSSMKY